MIIRLNKYLEERLRRQPLEWETVQIIKNLFLEIGIKRVKKDNSQ